MRTDFELRTSAGRAICKFTERARAVEEAERLAPTYPGLRVVRVEHIAPVERTVWTEARLRLVGVMSLRDTHRAIAIRYPRILGKLAEGPEPQPLTCELCDADCSADDWVGGFLAVLCPTCLENLMDNTDGSQAHL